MGAVVPRRPQRSRSSEQGFILPLALGVSLLALLGSLSLQSLALQSHLDQANEVGRGRDEDALAGAAQRLVAELNLHHSCLLPLPLSRWSEEGQGCAGLPQQAALQGEGGVFGGRLLGWSPGPWDAEALIEADPAVPGGMARRAVFRVPLQADPPRALFPRLLGLRGVAP